MEHWLFHSFVLSISIFSFIRWQLLSTNHVDILHVYVYNFEFNILTVYNYLSLIELGISRADDWLSERKKNLTGNSDGKSFEATVNRPPTIRVKYKQCERISSWIWLLECKVYLMIYSYIKDTYTDFQRRQLDSKALFAFANLWFIP